MNAKPTETMISKKYLAFTKNKKLENQYKVVNTVESATYEVKQVK